MCHYKIYIIRSKLLKNSNDSDTEFWFQKGNFIAKKFLFIQCVISKKNLTLNFPERNKSHYYEHCSIAFEIINMLFESPRHENERQFKLGNKI